MCVIEYRHIFTYRMQCCWWNEKVLCNLEHAWFVCCGCVCVCVFTFVCLRVSVWLYRTKCRLLIGHNLVACHIKGTVHSNGLSFTVLLVPNTTTLTTRQLHTEWLCYTDTGRTSFSFSFSSSYLSSHRLFLSFLYLPLVPAALLSVIIIANEVCRHTAPKTIFFSINSTNEMVIKWPSCLQQNMHVF